MAAGQLEQDRGLSEICRLDETSVSIIGDRQTLDFRLGMKLSGPMIGGLFCGVHPCAVQIKRAEMGLDIWMEHAWTQVPFYYTVMQEGPGIQITINDFFLKEDAPSMLGTRLIARMILLARQIPALFSINASATRWFIPREGETLRQEVTGYYFFPLLGFDANLERADDYIEIPETLKRKKLSQIMRDADLRQWWKENGQTIDVEFRLSNKRSLRTLMAYLDEKNIQIEDLFLAS